jgi:DNA polymerase III delta prime subunit
MALDIFIKDNFLHHAYCIVGNPVDVIAELETFLFYNLKFSIHENQDFWYGEYDVMDIEDSRKIKDLHQNRPVVSDRKVFVINTNFITEKAQNSMLKLFEEPSGDTHFFLIIPTIEKIIPTLRSRMIIVLHGEKGTSIINVKNFLKAPVGERLEMIKKLMTSISHEKSKDLVASDDKESKMEVVRFINSIEVELKKNIDFVKADKKYVSIFENLEKIRQYAGEQSPSLKMLLEHLALTI